MKELLLDLLYLVLTVGVPFLTAYLARYLRAKRQKTEADTSDAAAQSALAEIESAVHNAVKMVSQTYVDDLKKRGAFDEEAHWKARLYAVQAALNAMSGKTCDFIEKTYQSSEEYMKIRVEAEVREQKGGASLAQ